MLYSGGQMHFPLPRAVKFCGASGFLSELWIKRFKNLMGQALVDKPNSGCPATRQKAAVYGGIE
jgi:hypothetical protein